MNDELTLRFERQGDPPIEISSAWLIDESNAQQVAAFRCLDDYTVSLDLDSVPSGRYWMSAKIAKHPVLRFTINIKGDGERTVSFAGRPPRCATISVQSARAGAELSRRVHAINIAMASEHSAVILVAGLDYLASSHERTDYSVFARQWRDDLYYGETDLHSKPNQKIERAISEHTVVSIFNFATGDVQEQIRGVKGWHRMYEFMCGTERPHSVDDVDSISITHVYGYLDKLGRDAPDSVKQLHFFSHGYWEGPVLLDTYDEAGEGVIARDPKDKDPRRKDFHDANVKEHWPHLPQAFAAGALVKSWGCLVFESLRARINAVQHVKSRSEQVEHDGVLISQDSVMEEICAIVAESYVMAFVTEFNLDAWGPAPGVAANYKDTHHMYIKSEIYGSVVRWYEKSFGGRRDLGGYFPYARLKAGSEGGP